MYTTQQDVRDLLGLTIDEASDTLLEEFINYAQELIRVYIQSPTIDGKLEGNLNGINTTFSTEHCYFADTSGDTSITTADFKVYGWKDSSDSFSRDELSINTFDPLRGIIVLENAPSKDTYKKLTIDYSYYTKGINWELLALATAWKTAEIWVKREEFLVPESWAIGSKRIIQRQPWKYFEIEFNRVMNKLRVLPMSVVAYKKLVFRPRVGFPEVDSTSAKEVRGATL